MSDDDDTTFCKLTRRAAELGDHEAEIASLGFTAERLCAALRTIAAAITEVRDELDVVKLPKLRQAEQRKGRR